jgi:hypothetical protein
LTGLKSELASDSPSLSTIRSDDGYEANLFEWKTVFGFADQEEDDLDGKAQKRGWLGNFV